MCLPTVADGLESCLRFINKSWEKHDEECWWDVDHQVKCGGSEFYGEHLIGAEISRFSRPGKEHSYGGESCFVLNCVVVGRGQHLKRYSVIPITLRYVFELSQNALTLLRSGVASIFFIALSILFGAVIASYSYCSKPIGQRYCFYLLSLFHYYVSAFHFSHSVE
jgi:hypothetical protein